MKVQALTFNNFKTKNNTTNLKQHNQTNIQTASSYLPSTAQYLTFMGGYSINLKETYSHLTDINYPQNIKEAVEAEIANNNPENKTLYDIHFEKYKGILDCYSLDELKEKYPEFENVFSSYDVIAKEDSFVGKFQNNELELFSNDEDLTLQLIKLYWGQGFSLSDLSNYIAQNSKDNQGINLYYAMTKKLNIPMMDKKYASVLKLSNKEYNEQFTSNLSKKLKDAREAKEQKAQGEPVVIPRGSLSDSHKKHISESLKRHFQEHPEKIYEMSQRQKEFYENNPEAKEELSQAMLYAWNKTKEGKSISKHLSKFIRKQTGKQFSEDEIINIGKADRKTQKAFGDFWRINTWAKEKMSIAATKGWKHVAKKKEEVQFNESLLTGDEDKIVFNLMPTQMEKKIKTWAKENGYDIRNLTLSKGIAYKNEETQNREKALLEKKSKLANIIIDKYYRVHPQEDNYLAHCFMNTLGKLEVALKKEQHLLPQSLKSNPAKQQIMIYAFNLAAGENNYPIRENRNQQNIYSEVDITELYSIYQVLMNQALSLDCPDFIEFMDKELDASYDRLQKAGVIK